MVRWLAILAVWGLLAGFAHFVLRGRSGATRLGLLSVGCLLALATPWLLPTPDRVGRFMASMGALLIGFRLGDVAFRTCPDPAMQTTWPRFLVCFFCPADTAWPGTSEAARAARLRGRRRLARGLAKQAGLLGLLMFSTALPVLHQTMALHLFWLLWATYFLVAGVLDLAAGAWMQLGIGAGEVFRTPPLASSPRDFWSRRWNMIFRNAAHRLVFLPLRRPAGTVLAVLAVFALSALAHEYLVVASLGGTGGHMMAFFMLHALATVGYGLISQQRGKRPLMPRPLAVGLHMVWLTATAWFFFVPVLEVLPIHEWRLW